MCSVLHWHGFGTEVSILMICTPVALLCNGASPGAVFFKMLLSHGKCVCAGLDFLPLLNVLLSSKKIYVDKYVASTSVEN